MRFIGSKASLLENIQKVIDENILDNSEIFCDIFAGTNSVGYYFKPRYKIISNDLLYFSYSIAKGLIENNKKPTFKGLAKLGINDPFTYLSSDMFAFTYGNGFVSKNYAPSENCTRMYFTLENANRIDFAREQIELWKNQGAITESEYFYLLAGLIEGVPYVSNTTGTYGAYLKDWDKRAFKRFEFSFLDVVDNKKQNQCFNEDANELIRHIEGDILYIDPPYNERQYLPNYHVLETIAKNDNPNINGVTGVRPYIKEKSKYCSKSEVEKSFRDLISNAKFKHIIVSYSGDGLMSKDIIINILEECCDNKVKVYNIDYNRYKNKNESLKKDKHQEYLFYIENRKVKPKIIKKETKNVFANVELNKITKTKNFIKSPLNYIGGKYKLLPQLIKLFPNDINTFVDLFAGGFNVGVNVKANRYICNDINTYVVNLFKKFKDMDCDEILNKISNNIDKFQLSKTNESGYKELRNHFNKYHDLIDLYTLVCYSFNYQFRFNNNHEFNNPFGKNRSCFSDTMKENLIKFTSKLKDMDIDFKTNDFVDIKLDDLGYQDFIYCDPPYLITTGSYNDGNRGFKDWKNKQDLELLEYLDKANEKGIKFALSNVIEHNGIVNNDLLEWSKKYKVYEIDSDYSNCNYHKKDKTLRTREVLIVNY